jgi:hypothetical protein
VDTNEVGITVIIITLKHNHAFLKKSARIGNTLKALGYSEEHMDMF